MNHATRALGLLAAGLLLVGGLGHVPANADETTPDPALVGAPTVGSCFDLTMADTDAASAPEAAVNCAARHTSEVVAVSTLPAGITWTSTESKIFDAVLPVCARAWNKVTGGNPLRQVRSQYSWAWYGPTAEEQAAGARWFECHMIVLQHSKLAALPHPLPKLGKRIPDNLATCLTKSRLNTTCTAAHAWRASHSFYATGKATKRNTGRAADRGCPRHVTSRAWLASSWDIPGKRFIVICFSKTKR